MIEEKRSIRLKLLTLGTYSKALVLPKWWVKLNNNPEEVDVDLSFGFLGIEPASKEGENKLGVGDGN